MSPERQPWMPWVRQIRERPNRAARRKATRSETWAIRSELSALDKAFRLGANKWDEVSKEQGHKLSKIVYQGEPFISDYLVATLHIHNALDRMQWSNLKRPFAPTDRLNRVESHDLFSVNVAGTSLADIERMSLPLEVPDLKRIYRMWKMPPFLPSKNNEKLVKLSMVYLATKSVMENEKEHISPELSQLARRLVSFFDYQTNLMTDFSISPEEEANFLMSLSWESGRLNMQALGCYIPARLGILPSSAIKLYETRAESSFVPKFTWRGILNKMNYESRDAFLKDGLPEDLIDFGRYNPKTDKQSEAILLRYYKGKGLDGIEQTEGVVELNNLLNRFASNKNNIHREIRRSSDKQINIEMPEDHVASRLTVTAQNRETLVLILHFKDNSNFLTLEIDKKNNLFGIPPKVAIENPHLSDLVLRDVLRPTLAKIAPEAIVVRRQVVPAIIPVPVEEEAEAVDEIEEKEPKKRRRIRELLRFAEKKEPELPTPHEQPRRQYSVIHSREMVVDMLGKKTRPNDIDRLMRTIQRFEFGQVPVKTIIFSDDKRERRQVVRLGDYRIVLNHVGRGVYSLEAIGDRERVYDFEDHRRVG